MNLELKLGCCPRKNHLDLLPFSLSLSLLPLSSLSLSPLQVNVLRRSAEHILSQFVFHKNCSEVSYIYLSLSSDGAPTTTSHRVHTRHTLAH